MIKPQRYRAVPAEIQAVQFMGTNDKEIGEWLGCHLMVTINAVFRPHGHVPQDFKITVPCVGTAGYGDYITKSSTGLVQIMTAAAFEQTYQQVNA